MIIIEFLIFLQYNVVALEEQSQIVDARQILGAIGRGEAIFLNNVYVQGNLDLSGINLVKKEVPSTEFIEYLGGRGSMRVVNSSILIENSTINGNIYFNNTIFDKNIYFENTKFNGSTDFSNSYFNDLAFFRSTEYRQDAHFNFSHFNRTDFRYSVFNKNAFFEYAELNDNVNFDWANFKGNANFNNTRFRKEAGFWNSTFLRRPYFISSSFSFVDFGYSTFNKGADFSLSSFNDEGRFWWSKFNDTAYFGGTDFKTLIGFYYAEFNRDLMMNKTNFQSLDLTGAQFGKESKIYLLYPEFVRLDSNRIFVRWDSIKKNLIYDEILYLYLIKNFRNLAYFDDANNCYYQYRSENQEREQDPLNKFFDILAFASCGYGVSIFNTIISSIGIIVFFWVYFCIRSRVDRLDWNDFILKLKELFSFSTIILISAPSDFYPFGKKKYTKYINQYNKEANLERLIGWSLFILLINTLSRIMIRY